jgi:hypothetical protein
MTRSSTIAFERPVRAEEESALVLRRSMTPERRDHERRSLSSRRPRLRRSEVKTVLRGRERSLHAEDAGVQVDVGPSETENLLAAERQTQHEMNGRVPRLDASDGREDLARELRLDDEEISRPAMRPVHDLRIGRIPSDVSLRDRLRERARQDAEDRADRLTRVLRRGGRRGAARRGRRVDRRDGRLRSPARSSRSYRRSAVESSARAASRGSRRRATAHDTLSWGTPRQRSAPWAQ